MLRACIKISVAILRRIFAQDLTHESRELAKKVKIFRNSSPVPSSARAQPLQVCEARDSDIRGV